MHFYANSYPEIVETKLLANNSGILKPNYARLMFSHSKYYMYLGKQYVSGLISSIHKLRDHTCTSVQSTCTRKKSSPFCKILTVLLYYYTIART